MGAGEERVDFVMRCSFLATMRFRVTRFFLLVSLDSGFLLFLVWVDRLLLVLEARLFLVLVLVFLIESSR